MQSCFFLMDIILQNKVPLQDLAYKYDASGNKTDQIEDFFWKTLTDRRMYDNMEDEDGNYIEQEYVRLTDATADQVGMFASGAAHGAAAGIPYNADISANTQAEVSEMFKPADGGVMFAKRVTSVDVTFIVRHASDGKLYVYDMFGMKRNKDIAKAIFREEASGRIKKAASDILDDDSVTPGDPAVKDELNSSRAKNSDLASRDDTAIFIRNTSGANYLFMYQRCI